MLLKTGRPLFFSDLLIIGKSLISLFRPCIVLVQFNRKKKHKKSAQNQRGALFVSCKERIFAAFCRAAFVCRSFQNRAGALACAPRPGHLRPLLPLSFFSFPSTFRRPSVTEYRQSGGNAPFVRGFPPGATAGKASKLSTTIHSKSPRFAARSSSLATHCPLG